ncbi:zonular occludens toxin domain-containing protein [Ruficoccus sp. ZRK36]|uniref:zonular occludens toxin domain-containing protein n=1 Tax=Ruficoccus sp. ZRK36 TaxID=2866311 RepID=UPI001C72B7BF|nr:zonular occludens toxin domain-containing protein [Ruficoccus sp. ZRK36]QYY35158.1 hypothetical protein K0V07_12735 [Ruficoccus sp. ZRK36]
MKDAIFRVFAGTLGSYKSYHGVVEILETLERGAIVMTNIELRWDRIKYYFEDEKDLILDDKQYVHIDPERASSFVDLLVKGERDKPNKLIIDEAGLSHNTMDKQKMDRAVLEMIAHARKLFIDTVFISHDFHDILAQIRKKAQSVMWFRDLQKIKWLGIGLPLPMYIWAEVDARNPKLKYDSAWRWKQKFIYRLYVSHDIQSKSLEVIASKPQIELKKVERPLTRADIIKRTSKRWVRRLVYGGAMAGAGMLFAGQSHSEPLATPAPVGISAEDSTKPQVADVKHIAEAQIPKSEKPDRSIVSVSFMGRAKALPVQRADQLGYCTFDFVSIRLGDGRQISQSHPDFGGFRRADNTALIAGEVYTYIPPQETFPAADQLGQPKSIQLLKENETVSNP